MLQSLIIHLLVELQFGCHLLTNAIQYSFMHFDSIIGRSLFYYAFSWSLRFSVLYRKAYQAHQIIKQL
jgi:hypothetical protein